MTIQRTYFNYKFIHSMKSSYKVKTLEKIAFEIRNLFLEMIAPKETHHIGCCLSIIDILTVLYFHVLHIYPDKPNDPNRDIFVLSKGHAGGAVYPTLARRGFFDKKILSGFDRNNGNLIEHITTSVPGVEFSTGSLGHGLPFGVGYALSFKKDKKKNRVFVLMSDGELDEGSNWEAIMFSGHHKLRNLIAIVDKNNFQGYGKTQDIINLDPLGDKFTVFNWNVYETDGHDFPSLVNAFKKIDRCTNDKPHCVIASTVKGKGVPFYEGKFESHYKSLDEETKKRVIWEFNFKKT